MLCTVQYRRYLYNKCCGSGTFILDPGSEFLHPGSGIQGQKDPEFDSASKNLSIFNPKKTVFRIRICRIHVFLGLLDPDLDPLVRGMDPDPSVVMQK
jgi:hypothetical protein